jgi:hypothetical protein
MILIPIWVDDGFAFATSKKALDSFEHQLRKKFKITSEPLSYAVGMEIEEMKNGDVLLHQNRYIKTMLEKFKITPSKRKKFNVPLSVDYKLGDVDSESESDKSKVKNLPYAELIGCLMYAAVATRIDIMFAVVLLSRRMHKPTMSAWKGGINILCYLSQNPKRGIIINKKKNIKRDSVGTVREITASVKAYTDSDFANCVETRRSVSGYVVMVNGTPVVWSSRRQKTVALSTCEAEFVALVRGGCELLWVKKCLIGLGFSYLYTHPPTCFVDNTAAIRVGITEGQTPVTKHMSLKFFWVREKILRNKFRIQWIPSPKNPSDLLTKIIGGQKFTTLWPSLSGNVNHHRN